MRLTVIDQTAPELEDLAERSPQATFYHTRVWAKSLSRVFPWIAYRSIIAEEEGEVLGYLPFFIVGKGARRALWSLPFGTYGGPVTLDSNEVHLALLDHYAGLRRSMKVYETGWVDFWNRPAVQPFKTESAITHIIDLEPGFDKIWSESFDKSKRKHTKQAERRGVRVVETNSVEDAGRFHHIYASRITAAGGRVHYPKEFFEELLGEGTNRVKLFLAYHEDELLGGQLNFYFKDTVIAWYGVTTIESRALQASTSLYTHCIRHACDNGYKRFNLGGSMGKDSLMEYKMSFGGVPHRYAVSTIRSTIGKIAAAIKRIRTDR
ncbi:MAG: GNAT family N-acetyltransferase [Candidatus Latescibacteria bacterium]|nr:GNAT family N-acetyltransferase [Candidatus Latescibacterota bacterium]NIM21086.1 GNAT family N-acetyltransferase [Candidatus Latescibacterota bacterium]NIM65221.1 GNAT family N-acetyltransferase [Candidatus Latescibacterota bacterium]NIO01736.1 GNAT family N-acetyltransferase [Candidatus Latescibacterota bacterium]NIO28253.1 GNAT family N-acetyltransferase [Candidatus Latescibacterota bacterium]